MALCEIQIKSVLYEFHIQPRNKLVYESRIIPWTAAASDPSAYLRKPRCGSSAFHRRFSMPAVFPPEAGNQVVVHEPRGLEEGVDDHASHEGESPVLQVLADAVGQLRPRGDLAHGAPMVHYGPAVHEIPEVVGERSFLLAGSQKGPGVVHGRFYFPSVPDDARIPQKPLHVLRPVPGHALGVEALEGPAVGLAAAQDGQPGKPRLGALQDDQPEEGPVVPQRDSPFLVVIADVFRMCSRPGAARLVHYK